MRLKNKFFIFATTFILALGFFSCKNPNAETPENEERKADVLYLETQVSANLNDKKTDGYTLDYQVPYSAFDDATVFNKDLSQVSLLVACTTDTKEKIHDTFNKMGFDDFTAVSADATSGDNDYDRTNVIDSISYAIAHKKIGDYDVIALTVRGLSYLAEWANNFDMGATGDHKGFSENAGRVLEGLTKYLTTKYSDSLANNKVKLWITGYSRGGAIANVLAYQLMDGENKLSVDAKNIFIYTFSTPRGLTEDHAKSYTNVFNLISEADLVANIPPESYGMKRCGIDKLLYSASEEDYTRVQNIILETETTISYSVYYATNLDTWIKEFDPGINYEKFGYSEYSDSKDSSESKEAERTYKTEKQLLDGYLGILMEKGEEATGGLSFKTRELYAATIQPTVMYIINLCMTNKSKLSVFKDYAKEHPDELFSWLASKEVMLPGLQGLLDENEFEYDKDALSYHADKLFDALDLPERNGCITNLTIKILLPAFFGAPLEIKRTIDHHYYETLIVLLEHYEG